MIMDNDARIVRQSVEKGHGANYKRRLNEVAANHRQTCPNELENSAMISATLSFATEQLFLSLAHGLPRDKMERIKAGVVDIHRSAIDQIERLVREVGGEARRIGG